MTKLAPEWVRTNDRPSDQKPSTLPLGYGARRVKIMERRAYFEDDPVG